MSRTTSKATAGLLTMILTAAIVSSLPAAPRKKADAESLSREEVETIVKNAVASSDRTASLDGLRSNSDASRGPVVTRPCKMHIAVVDREGHVLAFRSMTDAWTGSKDIAIAKARTAAFFSSDENALTTRILGDFLWVKGDGGKPGPLYGINHSNQVGATGGKETRNGLITFPGGVALYKNGKLAGAIGVSGDAVDQDESVAFGGSAGYEPGPNVVKLGYTSPKVPAYEAK
jgi:uncharacterized protein GlcG (DUF336 family)